MARILICYYSRSGTTRRLASAVEEGAKSVDAAEVEVRGVEDVTIDDLKEFDGLIFGSPTYYGSMAAELKKLLDDSVAFHGQLAGKVGGAFATSALIGGGNETTVLSILQALLIHGMIVQGNSRGDHYGPVAVGSIDERAHGEGVKLGKAVAELAERLFG